MTTPIATKIERTLADLLAREAIVEAITTLFIATDTRDWDAVRAVLAQDVDFDMTSLAGGVPHKLPGAQIAATWEEGLRPMQAVHHQAGNFRVQLAGREARASCYGTAYHYRPHPSGRNTRVFVGSYHLRLREEEGRWRITSFRFDCKFVDGNTTLDRDD